MFFLIGVVIVFGSVIGGYMPHGDLAILMQPLELLIIGGGGGRRVRHLQPQKRHLWRRQELRARIQGSAP